MEPPNPAALAPDTLFHERYRVIRRIKGGGMGEVYEVADEVTARHRALKVMLPGAINDPDQRARFAQEAKITGAIESDHIVQVSDAGIDAASGMPFLVMALLHGEELGSLSERRGPLPPSEVVLYLSHVARALDKTHAAGVIHRDLKPENLFVTTRDDGTPCVKILDFGVAKLAVQSSLAQRTALVGTPLYMAPEQIRGDGRVGPKADVYALGHIAYALLAGSPYWMTEAKVMPSIFSLLHQIMTGLPEAPSVRAARRGVRLPAAFDVWFQRATARDEGERLDRATTAVARLAEALATPAPRPTPMVPAPDSTMVVVETMAVAAPAPEPGAAPAPAPGPRPAPAPEPRAAPAPGPRPAPAPGPRAMPAPGLRPAPVPAPVMRPALAPGPRAAPGPGPRAAPAPAPGPRPQGRRPDPPPPADPAANDDPSGAGTSVLVHVEGGLSRCIALRRDPSRVGRTLRNEIVLDDAAIAAEHALLYRRAGVWVLRDRAAASGMLHNDKPVVGEVPLKSGDLVKIGPFTLELAEDKASSRGERAIAHPSPVQLKRVYSRWCMLLDKEFRGAVEHKLPLSVLVLGVERLQAIEEADGRTGVECIFEELDRVLRRHTPHEAVRARLDDAFGLMLPAMLPARAQSLAKELAYKVGEHVFLASKSQPLRVKIRVGVAHLQPADRSGTNLLDRALGALREGST